MVPTTPRVSGMQRWGPSFDMNITHMLIANRDVAADGSAVCDRLNPLNDTVATRAAAPSVANARAARNAEAAALPF
jgi:hypothetical protein